MIGRGKPKNSEENLSKSGHASAIRPYNNNNNNNNNNNKIVVITFGVEIDS